MYFVLNGIAIVVGVLALGQAKKQRLFNAEQKKLPDEYCFFKKTNIFLGLGVIWGSVHYSNLGFYFALVIFMLAFGINLNNQKAKQVITGFAFAPLLVLFCILGNSFLAKTKFLSILTHPSFIISCEGLLELLILLLINLAAGIVLFFYFKSVLKIKQL